MAKDLDPLKLSSPRIFLFRMFVFVVLGGLVARLKNHRRLYSLAKFLAGPSPAPLQKLQFGTLLAVIFAIGLSASFLGFFIFVGLGAP